MTADTTGLRKFLKDSTLTFTQQALSLVLGFAWSVALARSLGKKGMGVYTLTLLFATMTVTLVNWGVPAATIYLVSSKKYDHPSALFNNLMLTLFQSIIGILGALAFLFLFKNRFLGNVDKHYLYWVLIIIPVSLTNLNLRVIFQAVGDFKAFNIVAISRLFWGVIFLTILFFFQAVTVSRALWATIAAEMLTFFLILYFLRKHISFSDLRWHLSIAYIKDILNYGWKIYIASIFTFFNYKQDRFLLNAYLSPASVGVYNIGANLGEKLWLLSQSVSTVLFPKIASLKDNEMQRRWITPFISRHIFLGTSLAAALLFWITPTLIQLFYGDEFVEAAAVLRVILPGVVFLTISRIVSNDISGRGHPGVNTVLSGVSLLINLTANLLLIPRWGVLGAAWASSISYTLDALMKTSAYSHIAKVPWWDIFILHRSDFYVWRKLLRSI